MKTYEEWIKEIVPWYLLGFWGERFFGAVGRLLDDAWRAMRFAVVARYIDYAPADALPYAVRDANVPAFIAFDTEGEVRTRVGDAWGWHARQGTEAGFDELFAMLGCDPDQTWYLDSSNGPHWFTETWWSCYAIVARNPLKWGPREETWAELEAGGLTWSALEALGQAFDFTAPASLFSQMREFMWRRKWAHAVPAYAVFSFGDGYTYDSLLAAGTTWADIEADSPTWDALGDATAVVIQTARSES